jgi:hypothetical protein
MKRFLLAVVAVLAWAGFVSAGGLEVQVGYADDLRANAFFPSPWGGDPHNGPGVQLFAGEANNGNNPGNEDSGAVRIINNDTIAHVINDLTVNSFADGASYHLWSGASFLNTSGGGFVLLPHASAIFAQTNGQNFDTSDQSNGGTPGNPSTVVPHVIFTIDGGVPQTFLDSGHVLDTGGFDLAVFPSAKPGDPSGNESLQWRDIGTTGISNPGGNAVPEPGTLTLAGLGIAGLFGYAWRRRRVAA